MNNERKPNDINMNDFFAKSSQMNNMLVVLDPNTTKHNTNELSKIVAKILPGRLAINFIKQGGNRLQAESAIKALLSTLEEADAISKKIRNAKEKRSNNHNKNDEFNNEQWKKDHSKSVPQQDDQKKHVQLPRS